MTTMHPDLAALAARYRELYDAASKGHISADDALATLAGMSVMDGHGSVWQVNPEGEFVRAQFVGAPPQKADPSGYVGPETVTSNPEIGAFDVGPHQQPTSPSWDSPHPAAGGFGGQPAPGPQSFGNPASGPQAFSTAAPGPQSFSGPPPGPQSFATPGPTDPFAAVPPQQPQPVGGFFDPATGTNAPTQLGQQWDEPPARSLSAAEDKHARGGLPRAIAARMPVDGFGELVRRNKVLVAIALLGVVVLGFAWFTRGGGEGTELPGENPGFAAPADGSFTDPPATGDPAATVTVPTPDDIQRVVGALTSGDRGTITKVAQNSNDPAAVARSAAFFAGLKTAGLTLDVGKAAATNEGALQTWQVKDGDTAVITVEVGWVKVDDAWKLAAVPTP